MSALVPDGLDAATRAALEDPAGNVLVATSDAAAPSARADVVHRPHQIGTPADLAVLAGLADRLVVTHQDLISFHNPGYFPFGAAWEGYRDLTRRALAAADRVLFFSAHAGRRARRRAGGAGTVPTSSTSASIMR